MKNLKWGVVVAVALGLLTVLGPRANAAEDQTPPPGGRRAPSVEQRIKRLTEALGLSQEQQDKLKPVLQNEGKKRRELRQDTSLSREDRRDKARAIREETTKQIKAILTSDQWEKYQKFLQENRGRRGPRQAPPGN